MDMQLNHFEEHLQRQELEPTELRRNLYELRTKFIQLERAFIINLQWHRRLEAEFNLLTLEKEHWRILNEDSAKERREISAELARVIDERDRWKAAFFHRPKLSERSNIDDNEVTKQVEEESDDILRDTGQMREKKYQDLLNLYNTAQKKAKVLEEEAEELRAHQGAYENRVLELANLLETLERFDVNVRSMCRLAVEALKNVIGNGSSFAESLRNLRKLSWTSNEKKNDTGENLLKAQNSVLMEIVKKYKQKTFTHTENNVSERDLGRASDSLSKKAEKSLEHVKQNTDDRYSSNNESREGQGGVCDDPKLSIQKDAYAYNNEESSTIQNSNAQISPKVCSLTTAANKDHIPQKTLKSAEKSINICESMNMLCIKSHYNGTLYEEYLIKFSNTQLMRIKHSPILSATLEQLNLEFTDNEDEYQEKYLKGIVIFLKNVNAVIKVTRTGVNCCTQTTRTKLSNNFTQTQRPSIQINHKNTMLNTERRAIDRSLSKLEQTVDSLQSSVLGQARNMMSKELKYRGNDEFFECVKLLAR